MFEPKMELTDNFRYVIENMPCCETNDPDIEQYVQEYVFDYFGLTFISSILLGGVAQQTIFIDKEAKQRLEAQHISVTNEAKVSFNVAVGGLNNGGHIGVSVTNGQTDTQQSSFQKEVRSSFTTTLGGASHFASLDDWSKTVASNPVVVELAIRDIFRLFTSRNFPQDKLIVNKSKLMEILLEKYLNGSDYCYDDCMAHMGQGKCESTGYFRFGKCKCTPGWTGANCALPELPTILDGTICGFDRSFMRVHCEGVRPWEKCPTGWSVHNWPTDLTVCYKNEKTVERPIHGIICGLYSFQHHPYRFDHQIPCNPTVILPNDQCPIGYETRVNQNPPSGSVMVSNGQKNALCMLKDSTSLLPGTLCGMQIEHSVDGPRCNGFNPGLSQCPPGYSVKTTAFRDYGFKVCVKD